MFQLQSRPRIQVGGNKYPLFGIIAALALNYLSPFVTSLLVYPAFLICVYRVIRYDEKVFATDYCLLISVSLLFGTSAGMSLLVYLCLFADVWYFIRRGIRGEATVVGVLLLLNYLILRMQFDLASFALCFGQLFLLYILIPHQDKESAERSVKAFCIGLLVSSAYALIFRNTWQIEALRGPEVPAYWGSSLTRFYGLFQDPNYYSMLLITSLALVVKLFDSKCVNWFTFAVLSVLLIACGILTYSKTFFVMLVLLIVIYLVWQFWSKRILRGLLLTVCIVLLGGIVLFSEGSPFSVVLTRFSAATDLHELTTGRSDMFVVYFRAITTDLKSIFFGKGLAANSMGRDPHNLFLEITYYLGVTGLVLMSVYYAFVVRSIRLRSDAVQKQHFLAKYTVLIMVAALHFTLHGMTAMVSYASFFVAALAMLIHKKPEEDVSCQDC